MSPAAALVNRCVVVLAFQLPDLACEPTRLNSYFSWNSETLPCNRSFEKLSVSTSFSSSATRPTMRVRLITSSPTVFIMRSRRSSAMRTDLTAAVGPEGDFAELGF